MVSVDFGQGEWFPDFNPPSSFEDALEVSHRLGWSRIFPCSCFDDRLQYYWRGEQCVPSLRGLGVISKGITSVPSITPYIPFAGQRYPPRWDTGPQGTQDPWEAGWICHIRDSLPGVEIWCPGSPGISRRTRCPGNCVESVTWLSDGSHDLRFSTALGIFESRKCIQDRLDRAWMHGLWEMFWYSRRWRCSGVATVEKLFWPRTVFIYRTVFAPN